MVESFFLVGKHSVQFFGYVAAVFFNPNFHLTKRLLVVDSSVHENCGKV